MPCRQLFLFCRCPVLCFSVKFLVQCIFLMVNADGKHWEPVLEALRWDLKDKLCSAKVMSLPVLSYSRGNSWVL